MCQKWLYFAELSHKTYIHATPSAAFDICSSISKGPKLDNYNSKCDIILSLSMRHFEYLSIVPCVMETCRIYRYLMHSCISTSLSLCHLQKVSHGLVSIERIELVKQTDVFIGVEALVILQYSPVAIWALCLRIHRHEAFCVYACTGKCASWLGCVLARRQLHLETFFYGICQKGSRLPVSPRHILTIPIWKSPCFLKHDVRPEGDVCCTMILRSDRL